MPIIAENTTLGFMGALILAVHKQILGNRIHFFHPNAEDLDDRISDLLRYQFRGLSDLVTDTEPVLFVGFNFAEDDLYWARDRKRKTAWIWYHIQEKQLLDHTGIIDINMQPPDLIGYLWHEYMGSGVLSPNMLSWLEGYGRRRDVLDALVEVVDLNHMVEQARQKYFANISVQRLLERSGVPDGKLELVESEAEGVEHKDQSKAEFLPFSGKAGEDNANIELIILDEAPNNQVVCSATSKIYHRTGCEKAKRISKRELFDSPEKAEGAGKRPCKACKPKG